RLCAIVAVLWLVVMLGIRRLRFTASSSPRPVTVASFDETADQSSTAEGSSEEPRIGGGFPHYATPLRVAVHPNGTTSKDSAVVDSRYPTPLLVDATDLAEPAVLDLRRALDVRPRAKYLDRHIPGAVSVDLAEWTIQSGRSRSDW